MKNKKKALICSLIILILLLIILVINVLPRIRYKIALKDLEAGDYDAAYSALNDLGKKKEIAKSLYDRAERNFEAGDYQQAYELALYLNQSAYSLYLDTPDDPFARKRLLTLSEVYYLCSLKNYEEAFRKLKEKHYFSYIIDKYDEYSWKVVSDAASEYVKNGEYERASMLLYQLSGFRCEEECYAFINEIRPKLIANIKEKTNVPVGSYIKLGYYVSENNTSNENKIFDFIHDSKHMLEWQVLAKEGSKMLLVSRDVLYDKPYDCSDEISAFTDWSQCSLRKWLNNEFIDRAFDPVVQHMLQSIAITYEDPTDAKMTTGLTCYDRVFILSVEEARRYLLGSSGNIPKWINLFDNRDLDAAKWWLRTLSPNRSAHSVIVNLNGKIDLNGIKQTENCGVRPAMWIDLDRLNGYLN